MKALLLRIPSQAISPQRDGFTLLELLVVIVILGVLSAIAVPNYIKQVGKARETEAKNNLSAIAYSQQAYHFEKQTFANNITKLNVSFDANYYSYSNPGSGEVDQDKVKHQAIPLNPTQDQVKNYAIGVYYQAGAFDLVLCQGSDINQTVNVPDTDTGNCTNNGIKLN